MIKNLAILFTVTFGFALQAQNAAEYQYIIIKDQFTKFKKNKYGLDIELQKFLTQKKYTVIPAELAKDSDIVKNSPCRALIADVIDDSSMLKNRVILELKDCNGNIVFSQKGASSIKDYREGFADALRQSIITLPVSNPSTLGNNPENSWITATVSSSEKNQNTYVNHGKNWQRISVNGKIFILSDGKSKTPFATFYITSKPNVFLVQLQSGEKTIGYEEQNTLFVDIPDRLGNFQTEIFLSK